MISTSLLQAPPVTVKTYGVGWHNYTPEQLETLFPGEFAEYREQAQYIVTFGETEAYWKNAPEEAQVLLDQILSVNSRNNLKALTPLGANGLFVVERQTFDSLYFQLSKYVPTNDKAKHKSYWPDQRDIPDDRHGKLPNPTVYFVTPSK